jgi:hypothetical protein
MTPITESATRRDPVEPLVGHAVFTNLMGCFRCDNCGALNLRSLWTGDIVTADTDAKEEITAILAEDPPGEIFRSTWYPVDIHGKKYHDVPPKIATAASEAHVCLAVKAYSGTLLLARSVIEATAKDNGITTGRLVEKIDAMHDSGLVRKDVRDGAHEVRHLGNDAAHGDFTAPVSRTDAMLILALMDEVLAEVYQGPARVARLKAAHEARREAET